MNMLKTLQEKLIAIYHIIMDNNYIAPNVDVIDIEIEGGFCISRGVATHEGTTEEDWDEPLP